MTASTSSNPAIAPREQNVRPPLLFKKQGSAGWNYDKTPDEALDVEMWNVYRKDRHSNKLNLADVCWTQNTQPAMLDVVRQAEERIFVKDLDKEYTRLDGCLAFTRATASLIFGSKSPVLAEERTVTVQALGGTGALRLAGEFIQRFMPDKTIYFSDPTWGNHKAIFSDAGVPWKTYKYFDPNTTGLDFAGMVADIEAAPDGSIILLHGCAHNPTGIDPTKEQWAEIADLCIKKNHFPFFDVAYQGFATGDLEEDAYAPRLFVEKGLEMIVAQSYSKNLGLYGERIGALNFVLDNSAVGARVQSQLERIILGLHCFPPLRGARLVTEILSDPLRFAEWKEVLQETTERINETRTNLSEYLAHQMPDRNWTSIQSQNGPFTFLGFNSHQIKRLRTRHHVYTGEDGTLSLTGLSPERVEYLAHAIVNSLLDSPKMML